MLKDLECFFTMYNKLESKATWQPCKNRNKETKIKQTKKSINKTKEHKTQRSGDPYEAQYLVIQNQGLL